MSARCSAPLNVHGALVLLAFQSLDIGSLDIDITLKHKDLGSCNALLYCLDSEKDWFTLSPFLTCPTIRYTSLVSICVPSSPPTSYTF